MDTNNNVILDMIEYASMIEAIVRMKVLAEFLSSHEYVSREDMFCILGIKVDDAK